MTENGPLWQRRFRFPIGWPMSFIILAAALTCAYLACHFLGFRTSISMLMQTSFPQGAGDLAASVGALVYLVLYFCYVVVVPILLGASAIMFILMRLLGPKRPRHVPPVRPAAYPTVRPAGQSSST